MTKKLNSLKADVLQKIRNCKDIRKLEQINMLLENKNIGLPEKSVQFSTEVVQKDTISLPFYKQLEEDSSQYKQGIIEANSWKVIRKNIYKRDGL